MKKKIVIMMVVLQLFLFIRLLFGQTLQNINAGLIGIKNGAVAWADIDGDLDAFMVWNDDFYFMPNKLYLNDGLANFSDRF